MSDETRKEKDQVEPEKGREERDETPTREEAQPRDDEMYTPQGGGGGTGAGPLKEVAAVEGAPRAGPREDLREDVARPGQVTLPQVGEAKVEKGDVKTGPTPGEGVPGQEDEVSSFRLLMTLGVAGALAGALLVFVFLWSQPRILAYEAMVLREAVTEVLKGPDHFESVFFYEENLVTAEALPQGVDTMALDRVFLGYGSSGNPVGFALQARGFGFQDIITLIFGYDPETDQVLGMKVLSHLETPGLGDKIVKDTAFVAGFEGAQTPLQGVKPDRNTGDPNQVDMITGATISSQAIIDIINRRLAEFRDRLAAYEPTGGVQEEGQ